MLHGQANAVQADQTGHAPAKHADNVHFTRILTVQGKEMQKVAQATQRPHLALQGLDARARVQLVALALCALERHTADLPDAALRSGKQLSCNVLFIKAYKQARCLACPHSLVQHDMAEHHLPESHT